MILDICVSGIGVVSKRTQMSKEGGVKQKRLAACDECKTRFFVQNWQYSRRAKIKCPGCGCSRFELVANDAMTDRGDVRAEAKLRSDKRFQGETT